MLLKLFWVCEKRKRLSFVQLFCHPTQPLKGLDGAEEEVEEEPEEMTPSQLMQKLVMQNSQMISAMLNKTSADLLTLLQRGRG